MSITDSQRHLAERILDLAKTKNVTLATAESCTGGLIGAALTEVAGSSAIFERGFVTYSNEAKTDMLGVPEHLIHSHGAVSEPVAKAMAEGALTNSAAAISVSVTGIAGPGGSAVKPEGMVCFGLAQNDTETSTVTVQFGVLGRSNVRIAAVRQALEMICDVLER